MGCLDERHQRRGRPRHHQKGAICGLLWRRGFVAQMGQRTCYPLPQTDLAYWLSDGYAKISVAVEDGDTDLDLCDLPIEAPRYQRLAE